MSRRILSQLQNYGKSYHHCLFSTNIGTVPITRNYSQSSDDNTSSSSSDDNTSLPQNKNTQNLGQTTILVQQGCDIQELPVILRKLKSDEFITILSNEKSPINDSGNGTTTNQQTIGHNELEIKPEEITALIDNCSTVNCILSIINEVPECYLCPEIAAHALDKLIRNESIIGLKNLEDSSPVFEKLVNCIIKNGDHKMLLDFMEVLKTFLDLQRTVQRFCDELLLRNSDGILNIIEICECIERFVDCKQQAAAEKFWSGLADAEKSIDAKNIKFIYKILPKLKISRRMVISIIERRIATVSWNLTTESVAESIIALTNCQNGNGFSNSPPPLRTMKYFSRWLNINIHAINEPLLDKIISSLTKLDFSNGEVEKALERYIKAKRNKIKAQCLIVTILEHSQHFRLRNHYILDGCSEYFISNSDRILPSNIKSIISTYGQLGYHPANSVQFWKNVENYLQDNFSQITPQDIIDVFLNCCYLEIYPLNFISSVFNPYFLDLLHTKTIPEKLPKIRNDLKLLDTSLTLDVNSYKGPLLPKDHSAKSIWQDGRIRRIVNNLNDLFAKIAGHYDNFTQSVIIGRLPTNPLYIVDLLIHPPGFKNFYSIRNDRNVFIAVLIMIPEYYDSKGEHIIGPQQMRIRHLRRLGMRIVQLNYETLAKLRVYPVQIEKYLVDEMRKALPAFAVEK